MDIMISHQVLISQRRYCHIQNCCKTSLRMKSSGAEGIESQVGELSIADFIQINRKKNIVAST